ncbi:MAG TPA: nucleotidyltransferase family protein [Thermoplasmata archaeon]|nr:nucleotidyltransferase family protein [Thermoplasmata archaeon]
MSVRSLASARSPPWSAVILSAGESKRFDGHPKALLEVGSQPAIARIASVCERAGADRTIAVLGPHRAEIEEKLAGRAVEVVENPDWSMGRTGSVQAGLRALADSGSVLVWPVDHPFVRDSTVLRLLDASHRDPLAIWFVPSFRGGGGHPILLREAAIPHVLALAPSAPLRSLLPELGPQVRHVPVEDAGVLENVDSFDAYWSALEAWRGRGGEQSGP